MATYSVELTFPGLAELVRSALVKDVLNKHDQLIYDELIRLGWTPPPKSGAYELGVEGLTGQPFIKCKTCELRSFHPEDIKQRYCGNCRTFL